MRPRRWALLGVVVLAACGSPRPTPSADAPSGSETGTMLVCGDLPADVCPAAAESAVATVVTRVAIVRVELGRGVWCPTPGLLFANTTCPAGGFPPDHGGQWIGHALITFHSSQPQAYVNIAKDAGGFHGTLIALATPPPTAS